MKLWVLSSFVILEFVILPGSQGVIRSARRFAKAEVRGANPRESTNLKSEKVENQMWCGTLSGLFGISFGLRYSAFGFISDFGIRVSDFLRLCASAATGRVL